MSVKTSGLPLAANTNLLAASPMVVKGLASSATAVENARTASFAADQAAGVQAVHPLIWDNNSSLYRRWFTAEADAITGDTGPVGLDYVFNGATFDRIRSANSAADTTGTGLLGAGLLAYDGTNYRRVGTQTITGADAQSGVGATQLLWTNTHICAFNGASWDRARNNAAANIDDTTQPWGIVTASPGEWTELHNPGANTQATASKAAGGAGVRHVARGIDVTIANDGAAKTGIITVNLRDGASGAGTIKRSWLFIVPAGDTRGVSVSDLNIFGTANTAMTIETAAAPGANVSAVVNISGYSTV